MILAMRPAGKRTQVPALFRGARAHDYDWLKARYFESGGPAFPSRIANAFSLVNTWGTELRYKPGTLQLEDAQAFLDTVAEIMPYRQNSVAVRVRIIDPDFSGVSRVQRHNEVWRYFEALPEEDQSQISLLLLYTPEEAASSFANMEFEDPVPSSLL